MDYRFVIIFLVIICCAVMAIMILRAIQYEIGLNRIRSREAVSELRKFQLDEYRAQLTAVRDQMQDRLEKRIRASDRARAADEMLMLRSDLKAAYEEQNGGCSFRYLKD